jgi:2-polyprenyl-6-methoxyphenol hydroxylase-like FAD-dependent oxidoreductase
MSRSTSGTVVVIGRSMAGLAAARALHARAKQVIVLEPDIQSDDEEAPRKGVPQGRQVHILLKNGERVLERFFPGFTAELEAAGSQQLDPANDLAWFHANAWKPRFAAGFHIHFQRRLVLEKLVRRRVQALGNVELRDGARVTGLVFDAGRVVGVKVGTDVVAADLVVDASGRGSQAAKWFAEGGFDNPPVDHIGSDVSYATALVELAEPPTDYKALVLYPALPIPGWGIVFPIDNGQYIVTLIGRFDDVPSTERAGFIAFAARLGVPHLHALIHDAQFVSDITRYHFKGTRYIRYDKAARLPRGFVALGDALCSFNPIFGQGMTTAFMTAEVLQHMTQDGESLDIDPRSFFQRAAKTLAFPWKTGVIEDFRSPQTTGTRPFGLRLNQALTDLMNARSAADTEFFRTYSQVLHMLLPPSALLTPSALASMLLGSKKPLSQGPRARRVNVTTDVTTAMQPAASAPEQPQDGSTP